MRGYSSNIAFIDLLFNLLIGFTSLLLIAFLLINPVADEGVVNPRAEFLITMSWLDTSGIDLDIWIEGPNKTIVGFPQKDGAFIILERDDLGDNNDTFVINGVEQLVERNLETVSINAIVPGEYFVSVHNYNSAVENDEEEYPTPVTVDLMDLEPYSLVLSKQISVRLKEEKSVFSFMINEKGEIYDLNDDINIKIRPSPKGGTLRQVPIGTPSNDGEAAP